jgi:preprotein translocase subunit Sec61beta
VQEETKTGLLRYFEDGERLKTDVDKIEPSVKDEENGKL